MKTTNQLSKEDISWIIIILVIFIPLSLWGGSLNWGGGTGDLLFLIMLLVGLLYIIVQSVRAESLFFGTIIGGLVPLSIVVPSMLTYSGRMRDEDLIGTVIISVVGACLGAALSSISRRFSINQRIGAMVNPAKSRSGDVTLSSEGIENTSGQGKSVEIPPEVKKWNWGAFFLNWIWGLGNKTYIALLCLIPVLNLIIMFVLGARGSEWAWRNKRWNSIEHFQRVQKLWGWIGLGVILLAIAIRILTRS